MAFPQLVGTTTTYQNNSTALTHTVPFEAPNPGDLIAITMFLNAASPTPTAPGWTTLSVADFHHILYRVADGSEGTSVVVTISVVSRIATVARRFTGASGDIEAIGLDGIDPPALTPSWGAEDTLWIAAVGSLRSDWTLDAAPAGYSDFAQAKNSSSTATSRIGHGSAIRALNAASEDPGVFTFTGITDSPEAVTYAIRAAADLGITGTLGVTDGADTAAIAGGPVTISGTTRDAQGAPLGGVTVRAFLTADNTLQASTTSNGSGVFSMDVPTTGAHYLVAYLEGAPDVAGVSRNDIVPGGGGA